MEKTQSYALYKKAYAELERSIVAAVKTYSNVHRGTGHYSMITTALFERARDIILNCLKLDRDQYVVIFCSPRVAEAFRTLFNLKNVHIVSSEELGLPFGLRAVIIEKKRLPKGPLIQTGGGTVKMVYSRSVIWADPPNRFEAGTPNIISAIALAKALQVITSYGHNAFQTLGTTSLSPTEILYQDDLSEYSGQKLLSQLRTTLMGSDVRVPTTHGSKGYVNLDNAASTPTFSPIMAVVGKILRQPKKRHQELIQEVRKICAAFLGAPLEEYDVIFTSNTTEAINLVAQNQCRSLSEATQPVVVTTLLEHNSNELPWRYFAGASVIRVAVDEEGVINLNELEGRLREFNHHQKHGLKRISLVAVSGASNVLGVINDLQVISQLVHRYGAKLLVDGAQLIGNRPISLKDTDIDYFVFSGHKIYAPFGSGALIVRKGLLGFSSTEFSLIKASGEENVVGIATMGKALILLQRVGLEVLEQYDRRITWHAIQGLAKIPGVRILGLQEAETPQFKDRLGIIVIRLNRVPHNIVAKELAEKGAIGVRNGCFCAHLLVSRLLKIPFYRVFASKLLFRLMPELTSKILPGLVRVSFGLENNETDVDHFIRILTRIAKKPWSLTNRILAALSNGTPFVPYTKTQAQMNEYIETLVQQVFTFPKA